MTALEYMIKQLNKHRLNLERETKRGVPEEMLRNIEAKIGYYEAAIEALKVVADGVVEVRHGEWILKRTGRYGQFQAWCTACGQKKNGIGGIASNQVKPYCPNCGAKMDGKRKDGAVE